MRVIGVEKVRIDYNLRGGEGQRYLGTKKLRGTQNLDSKSGENSVEGSLVFKRPPGSISDKVSAS